MTNIWGNKLQKLSNTLLIKRFLCTGGIPLVLCLILGGCATTSVQEQTLTVRVTTEPEGAEVLVNGVSKGTTNSDISITFQPSPSRKSYLPVTVVCKKEGFESASFKISPPGKKGYHFRLKPIYQQVTHQVRAFTENPEDGQKVAVEGIYVLLRKSGEPEFKLLDKTYLGDAVSFDLEYRRDNQGKFPTHELLLVDCKRDFKRSLTTLTAEENGTELYRSVPLDIVLEAESTYEVAHLKPVVKYNPNGIFYGVPKEPKRHVATRDRSEPGGTISGPYTQYSRKCEQDLGSFVNEASNYILPNQSISSFTLSSKGDYIIYALTDKNSGPEGGYQSYLVKIAAASGSQEYSILTPRGRLYANPFVGYNGHDQLVFQADTFNANRPDIHSVPLNEQGLFASNEVKRLTFTEDRYHYNPHYYGSNDLFFMSIQADDNRHNCSQTEHIDRGGSQVKYLSAISRKSSEHTEFSIHGDTIYYTKKNEETGKWQIYFSKIDGGEEHSLLSRFDQKAARLMQSDCMNPVVSKDGKKVLFVSNGSLDANTTQDENIWVVSSEGISPHQLTFNESRDYHPVWEPNVEGRDNSFYFLSNRGGADNIWKLQIAASKRIHASSN